MCFILKERICPLLIKLFSPSTKLKLVTTSNSPSTSTTSSSSSTSQQQQQSSTDASQQRNTFAIVSRLIRIVFVLIKSYFELLITESEIFLSLLAKFLDMDRPVWQKALAIECLHKIALEPKLIQSIVVNYDMQTHPEKIFHLMTNGIALFIQSLFLSAATTSSGGSGGQAQAGGANAAGNASSQQGSGSSGGSQQQQQQQSSFAFQAS